MDGLWKLITTMMTAKLQSRNVASGILHCVIILQKIYQTHNYSGLQMNLRQYILPSIQQIRRQPIGKTIWTLKALLVSESTYASTPLLPSGSYESAVRVYNLQDILIGKFDDKAEAISRLKSGLYIINGMKVRIQ